MNFNIINNFFKLNLVVGILFFYSIVSFSQTQIKGKIENCNGCKINIVVDKSDFTIEKDFLPSHPDQYGNFVFDLQQIYRPSVVLLEVNSTKVPVYVEPNQQTWIKIAYHGHYFDYSFENTLASENNHLKNFYSQYGWINNKQAGDIWFDKTLVSVKGNLFAKYNSQPSYLKADHLSDLHSKMNNDVQYNLPMGLSSTYQKYIQTYAKHASLAYVYNLAMRAKDLNVSDEQRIFQISYANTFEDSDRYNPAFIPHLKSYAKYQTKIANIDTNDFNQYFDYVWRNATQIPMHLREQYMIHLIEKNLSGENVQAMKPTILQFMQSMSDLDRMSKLMGLYNNAKKQANGRRAPNFTLEDKNGNMVSLSSLRGKNIYLAFWSSSCRPCIEGMKKSETNKYYLQGDNIKFVYISTDLNRSTWLANSKVQNSGKNDIHLWAGKSATNTKEYNAIALPTYYFINTHGNFISEFPMSWENNFVNFVRYQY